jgi:putative ABC transport system substrate-binding protein
MRAHAQTSPPIAGYLGTASAEAAQAPIDALRRELREVGLIEGRTIQLESRYAGGDVGRLDALIAELVAMPVSVFLVSAMSSRLLIQSPHQRARAGRAAR